VLIVDNITNIDYKKYFGSETMNIYNIENILDTLNEIHKDKLTAVLNKDSKFDANNSFQTEIMTKLLFGVSYRNILEAVEDNNKEATELLLDNSDSDSQEHYIEELLSAAISNSNMKIIDLLTDEYNADIDKLSTNEQMELINISLYRKNL